MPYDFYVNCLLKQRKPLISCQWTLKKIDNFNGIIYRFIGLKCKTGWMVYVLTLKKSNLKTIHIFSKFHAAGSQSKDERYKTKKHQNMKTKR